MPTVKANGCELNYVEFGNKGGKTFLFVPGLGTDCNPYWLAAIERFGEDYHCISFDQRGVGLTDYPDKPFTIEDMADDTLGLIEELDLKDMHILGSSMGACVSQVVVKTRPDLFDKVIFGNTFPRLSRASRCAFNAMKDLFISGNPEEAYGAILPWLYSATFLQKEGVQERIWNMFDERRMSIPGRIKQLEALVQFDGFKYLDGIHHDTLLIVGKEDLLPDHEDLKQMNELIKNAKLALFPCGHAVHTENPDEFKEEIFRFLQGS